MENRNDMNLNILIKTWNKDTDDLYDFEANNMMSKEFKIGSGETCYLVVCDDKISASKNLKELQLRILEDEHIIKVIGEVTVNRNAQFQVVNPINSSTLNSFPKKNLDRLWHVLPKNELKPIEEGDILKLGRIRLKIDKIVFKQNDANYCGGNINYLKTNATSYPILPNNSLINNLMMNNTNNISMNMNNVTKEFIQCPFTNNDCYEKSDEKPKEPSATCKICFRADSDFSDPLMTPCKCSGSMGLIHYSCLKRCIEMKINKKENENYKIFVWKNFECEICLHEYPKYLKYKSYVYNLVDINVPFEQYIIMDHTIYDDAKKKSFRKGIIAVRVNDDEEILIGRTQSNIIKLKDISVSRLHCSIVKKNNQLYVMDKGSKFGTLLYLKDNFTFTKDDVMSFVSGRNFIEFKLSKSWNFLSRIFSAGMCCKYKQTNEHDFVINCDDEKERENFSRSRKNLNDSYSDYVINLDTIIKYNESINNNNSFI